jgi:hypothetical protein
MIIEAMSHKYLIALNLEARRAAKPVDLAEVVRARFGGSRVRVIERGFKGRTVTVEMADTLVNVIQDAFPFVTVERAREMDLLG